MSGVRLSSPLTIERYLESVTTSNQFAGSSEQLFTLKLGLFGEVGELYAGIKKARRDALTDAEARVAAEEVGDALWYLLAIALHQKVEAKALVASALKEIAKILNVSAPRSSTAQASFRQIVGFVNAHASPGAIKEVEAFQRLAARVGLLVSSPRSQAAHLAEVLADLALLAYALSLDLEEIAAENIAKTNARWPKDAGAVTPLFDSACKPGEQLPRKLWVRFEEKKVKDVAYVYISVNGVNVGDRLTDNSHEPDDYRFHDVFHLAYAAYLGWSPVLRALLKKKRKSSYVLDENEDGARAIITEEGISTWMFNVAREHLFLNVTQDKFPYALLKQIRALVKGYEVDECQPWEWARAILKGFEVFRQLKKARGGYVLADLDAREITYKGLKEINERIEYKEVRRKPSKSKAVKRVQPLRRRVSLI